jgi:hypothetical protein
MDVLDGKSSLFGFDERVIAIFHILLHQFLDEFYAIFNGNILEGVILPSGFVHENREITQAFFQSGYVARVFAFGCQGEKIMLNGILQSECNEFLGPFRGRRTPPVL